MKEEVKSKEIRGGTSGSASGGGGYSFIIPYPPDSEA
ncbi:uncharacterized protein G2W53_019911 [Senna tora]|uniref:Uncharacterized protein n=1 Tax=Senna tora TaxID=362788 RepID=A0A834TWY3_9FABA|nr:uncharacterized protein G2W53_019911 [Senna tora]